MSYSELKRKWFQGAGERQEDVEREKLARATWRGWVRTAGYTQFKHWLEEEIERNEIEEGEQASMTVQVGVRRGLRKVTAKLRDIERSAMEES